MKNLETLLFILLLVLWVPVLSYSDSENLEDPILPIYQSELNELKDNSEKLEQTVNELQNNSLIQQEIINSYFPALQNSINETLKSLETLKEEERMKNLQQEKKIQNLQIELKCWKIGVAIGVPVLIGATIYGTIKIYNWLSAL